MQRKERFPPEAETKPDVLRAKALVARPSGRAPSRPDDRAERPTEPPPPKAERRTPPPARKAEESRVSVMRARTRNNENPAAKVDEVVADLSHDPRRERDEDD